MKSKALILTLFFVSFLTLAKAQNKQQIQGIVINGFTKEPVPYASIYWQLAKYGTISDSLGNYSLNTSSFKNDSLIVNYVGFEQIKYALDDIQKLKFKLTIEKINTNEGVTVKSKFNKGLRWWKEIVKNKKNNNPYNYPKYNCEIYNKLELDLNNINRNSFSNISFLKQFSFILDNIDSVTDEKPFLPFLMTETISDYYYSKDPSKTKEIIKASQSHGIKSETMMQLVSGVNQKINIYDNYIKILGKEFISPISDFGDKFYKYRGADTQYIKGNKVFHFIFSPLNDGENTFNGDAWIDANTWAVHKINLNISPTADVNFVNRLNVSQEFEQLETGKLIFSKDKLTVDFSPFPKDKLTLIVRKSNSYQKFNFNEDSISVILNSNKKDFETIYNDEATTQTKSFWNNNRHDILNKNEQNILKMIDTLKSIPLFKEYTRNAEFIIDGHRKYGPIEIGPWYKWISGNQLEKTRLRFDLGTTEQFSKQLRLYGYLAYGIKYKAFKENLGFIYKFKKIKGFSAEASYLKDLDNGRVRFSEEDITTDNIFSQLFRRPGIPQKFLGIEEFKLNFTKDWESGISNNLILSRTDYEPYTPLPNRNSFTDGRIVNANILYRFRYAPGEKKIETNRKKLRFKGNKPIYELSVNQSINGLIGSKYNYTKISAGVSQKFRIPSLGIISYNVYGGKIYGDSLPFMLLELHPGNEVFVYNKNGFNLMNRFEYYSDNYAGFQIEHNFEKKLINLVPFLRKTSIRQFWNLKGVWGNMNTSNRVFNRTELGPYQLRSLRDHTYLEFGTGFDNIFKFFRIDFVWRQAPPYPANYAPSRMQPVQNFGVFGSLRIQL
jgi:hypothetical protein